MYTLSLNFTLHADKCTSLSVAVHSSVVLVRKSLHFSFFNLK